MFAANSMIDPALRGDTQSSGDGVSQASATIIDETVNAGTDDLPAFDPNLVLYLASGSGNNNTIETTTNTDGNNNNINNETITAAATTPMGAPTAATTTPTVANPSIARVLFVVTSIHLDKPSSSSKGWGGRSSVFIFI
ncbi:hypothetical protein MAPG_10886 [Magnaporthiopsis poae ATCC 64411]|uniref:Uncharacterized protein n=1 Tax=Magnaporthiopsis poae (strain ATCC 64411 / 73-15) TaxID=644358 RepID=A0A0C4EDS6_MAGP6|nr:hypothetical protein MAPG_10886 [Magnaporthiopsis poae ATCC 64411]